MMLIQQPQFVPSPPPPSAPRIPPRVPTPTPIATTSPKLSTNINITTAATTSPLELTKSQWEASKASTPIPASNPPFHLRAATPGDASQIAHLGGSTFAASFGFSIPTADLTTYLREAYSRAAIDADIRSADKHFLVGASRAETGGDGSEKVLGFAQLTEGTSEPCLSHIQADTLVELQRLYVYREAQGLGVGKALMAEMERMARRMGYTAMWLGVWEGNFVAQRVYEGMGFERVGDHEFRMGRCIQTDWIMLKELYPSVEDGRMEE